MRKLEIEIPQNEDGTYNESTVKRFEELTGRPFSELVSEADNQNPAIPEGDPRKWPLSQKNEYITKHGQDGWKSLLQERK